jgi:hypothetical protein
MNISSTFCQTSVHRAKRLAEICGHDRQAVSMISLNSVNVSLNSVSEIFQQIEQFMRAVKPARTKVATCLTWGYYIGAGVTFVIAFLLAVPLAFDKAFYGTWKPKIVQIGLASLGVCYSVLVAYQIGVISLHGRDVWKFLKQPHLPVMHNAQKTATDEFKLFEFLCHRRIADLRYVLAHFKAERQDFESRVTMLIGPVAKVGLLPGAATYLAYLQTVQTANGTTLQLITQVVTYVIPFFYFMALLAKDVTRKMDLKISAIELAVQQLDSKKS